MPREIGPGGPISRVFIYTDPDGVIEDKTTMKRLPTVPGILLLITCVGCGQTLPAPKPTVGVGGKVVFSNGEPVRCAYIILEPKNPAKGVTATGWIDQEGKFTLRSYSVEEPDGAVKGEYLVRLEPYDPGIGVAIPKDVKPSHIPSRYLKTSTSELTAEIEEETDSLEFKIN
jgi:hypothetical protein